MSQQNISLQVLHTKYSAAVLTPNNKLHFIINRGNKNIKYYLYMQMYNNVTILGMKKHYLL